MSGAANSSSLVSAQGLTNITVDPQRCVHFNGCRNLLQQLMWRISSDSEAEYAIPQFGVIFIIDWAFCIGVATEHAWRARSARPQSGSTISVGGIKETGLLHCHEALTRTLQQGVDAGSRIKPSSANWEQAVRSLGSAPSIKKIRRRHGVPPSATRRCHRKSQ
jgi:hypothetical protein